MNHNKNLYIGPFRVPQSATAIVLLAIGFAGGYVYHQTQTPDIFSSPNTLPQLNVCFSPHGHCENMATSAINAAKNTIYARAYAMTSQPITDALIAAQQRGVVVKLLVDRSQLKEQHSKIRELKSAGIVVKIEKVKGIAHNKVLILDRHILVTGSYNWSHAANVKNAENMLLINDPQLANAYLQDWLAGEFRSQHLR